MELQVYVDGITYTHNEESLSELIKKHNKLEIDFNASTEDRVSQALQLIKLREKVYEFFSARFIPGDDDINVERNDVNELLSLIGADLLARKWNLDVTITVSMMDIEAASEEEAIEIAENEIQVEYYGEGDLIVEDVTVDNISAN
jgi:hypothetical protein